MHAPPSRYFTLIRFSWRATTCFAFLLPSRQARNNRCLHVPSLSWEPYQAWLEERGGLSLWRPWVNYGHRKIWGWRLLYESIKKIHETKKKDDLNKWPQSRACRRVPTLATDTPRWYHQDVKQYDAKYKFNKRLWEPESHFPERDGNREISPYSLYSYTLQQVEE